MDDVGCYVPDRHWWISRNSVWATPELEKDGKVTAAMGRGTGWDVEVENGVWEVR
jgi:hypothetical protein